MKKRFLLLAGLLLGSIAVKADLVYDFSKPDKKNKHYTHAWARWVTERKVVDGVLYGKTMGHPSYFTTDFVNLPLERAQLLVIEMMAEPTSKEVQVHVNTGKPSASWAVKKLKQDGKFHHYVFDFEEMPKVKSSGMLHNYRVNPVNSKTGKKFGIKSIRLMPKQQHVPGVEAVIPKAPAKLIVPEFIQMPTGGKAEAPTSLEVSYDEKYLIIDFKTALNNVNYQANGTKDGRVFSDDNFDINIMITRDSYYQIIFNPVGTVFDRKVIYADHLPKDKKSNDYLGMSDMKWDSNLVTQNKIAPGIWSGRAMIPWKAFGLTAAPKELHLNIARLAKAAAKGYSSWNYSPVMKFADRDNMRKLTLGSKASAQVVVKEAAQVLPGKNIVQFANPDRRDLVCKVTVRDLGTGKSRVFSSKAASDTVNVEYELGESSYELLFTAFEDGRMLLFNAKSVNTSAFRKEFAIAFNAVKRWKNIPAIAALKKELLAEGSKLAAGSDFAGMKNYIDKVGKVNLKMQLDELYSSTLKNFNRSALPFAVASASSADKIFRSLAADVPPFMGKAAAGLEIFTAKNETEGTQLVLVGMDKPVEKLSVKLVKKPAGKAPEIKLYGIDFHDTRLALETKYKVSYRGEWPEVLANDLPKKLAVNEVRSIWVKAETALDVPAGVYDYTIEVTAANMDKPLQIPVKVKVWDFAVPVVPTLRTALSNLDGFIYSYYERVSGKKLNKKQRQAVTEMMVRFMLKYRMNPGHIYTMRTYNNQLVEYPAIEKLAEYNKLGLNAVTASQLPNGSFGGSAEDMVKVYYNPERKAKMLAAVKRSYEVAAAQGMDKMLYIHAYDEIFAHTHKQDKVAVLKNLVAEIRKVAPTMKIECITEVLPELIGVIDIWCPSIKMMAANPKSYHDRQKAGDELWLYTCLGEPGSGNGTAPSFVLEESAAAMRLVGWICYFYNAEGFLYYSMGNWSRNGVKGEKPYPQTPWSIQHVNGYNGEAVLFYPAKNHTMEPLSSIRLENLRDGFEDYEYFKLLAAAFAKNGSKLTAAEKAEVKALLAMKELVRSGLDYTDDSAKIAAHRAKMAKWIERLSK